MTTKDEALMLAREALEKMLFQYAHPGVARHDGQQDAVVLARSALLSLTQEFDSGLGEGCKQEDSPKLRWPGEFEGKHSYCAPRLDPVQTADSFDGITGRPHGVGGTDGR